MLLNFTTSHKLKKIVSKFYHLFKKKLFFRISSNNNFFLINFFIVKINVINKFYNFIKSKTLD